MSRRTPAYAIGLTGLAAAALAGCGKMGPLERPGPILGEPAGTTSAAVAGQSEVRDPGRPVQTVDPRDQVTDPAPPRTLPVPGTSPNPTAPSPPSALPDPYARPR